MPTRAIILSELHQSQRNNSWVPDHGAVRQYKDDHDRCFYSDDLEVAVESPRRMWWNMSQPMCYDVFVVEISVLVSTLMRHVLQCLRGRYRFIAVHVGLCQLSGHGDHNRAVTARYFLHACARDPGMVECCTCAGPYCPCTS